MQATRSYGEKIALAAGSLASLGLVPGVANAAVVAGTGGPISLSYASPSGASVSWDIDHNGTSDFNLNHWTIWSSHRINLGNQNGGSAGFGVVVPTGQPGFGIKNLAQGFTVGPALAAGYGWAVPSNQMMLIFQYTSAIGFGYNLQNGTNYIGFEFNGAGGAHFGWAQVNLDPFNGIVTIQNWAYNDTPGGAVVAGDVGSGSGGGSSVPEPTVMSLLLLGLGAGGVRAWRRQKRALNS